MAINNTDFLRFSAYSIKDLITRKLSQDTKYTDQVYEGSNLAILIDIFSYIGQSLLYSLNTAAAESMWSDTLLYENINRLAKFLSYNPRGVTTSNCNFTFNNTDESGNPKYEGKIILPYTSIDTGKTDSDGNKIYYSIADSFYINSTVTQLLTMYNGKWKQYDTVFVSSGDKYQTFTLVDLQSNAANGKYVVDKQVHVYVRHYDALTDTYSLDKYTAVDLGLFTDNNAQNGVSLYTASDKIYNLRLNEDKTYEIMFGNGINGLIPATDDLIYIFYLLGNGIDGQLDPYEVKDASLKCSADDLGISIEIFNELYVDYQGQYDDIYTQENGIKVTNNTKSTVPTAEETVEEIRVNAPNWFKIGNRLVTSDDWIYYLKNRFSDNIIDVKCQNNYEYMSSFYKWLYELGIAKHNNGSYYLNPAKLLKYGFKLSDAADANDIYLWIKMKNQSDIYALYINNDINNIKNMTSEPVFLLPLITEFAICAAEHNIAVLNLINNDISLGSYIEVTMSNNTMYTTASIKSQVANVIQNYFDENKLTLGDIIDMNEIMNNIYNINGIERIRTIWVDPLNNNNIVVRNGLSFASWTNSMIDTGDDIEVTTSTKALLNFLFPSLFNADKLIDKIMIISKSTNNVNAVLY